MNVTAADRFTVEDAAGLYGLDAWGNGYLKVREDGRLIVNPTRDDKQTVDVLDIVQRLQAQGIQTPVLLRFPQLLKAQIDDLAGAFAKAIEEYAYPARFLPVFPMKVNQHRAVVDALLASGARHGLGLEVGSRPELLAATAADLPSDGLIICNGFKDDEYLSSAVLAARLGKRVVVVVEKPFEVERIVALAAGSGPLPLIGFRIRLQARGSGLWEKSGGFASKFGLTTRQLLQALERLSGAGLSRQVALLHFHVGSQITEIRRVKTAVREGGRIYAKLCKLGVPLGYLDVGGGLGVDYDGSRTSSDASVNYTVQEYANDVVFGIQEVCAEEEVPPPAIISESGRMLVAYHSMLVANVQGVISVNEPTPPTPGGETSPIIQELAEIDRTINVKNHRELYHDAIEYREQMYSLFDLGLLGLEDRAFGESLFWSIAAKAVRYARTAKFVAEEFIQLDSKLRDKYICNFSVFQSLPDHWALDQLFPVLPIHRLNERPTRNASLVDITCDSDGEVDKFVDLKDIKESIPLHEPIPGGPYYLAFVLVGAYQDTMGDLHNLFGRVHEAEVVVEEDGTQTLSSVRPGETAIDALSYFGYREDDLVGCIGAELHGRAEHETLGRSEAARLLEDYREHLRCYTYLRRDT